MSCGRSPDEIHAALVAEIVTDIRHTAKASLDAAWLLTEECDPAAADMYERARILILIADGIEFGDVLGMLEREALHSELLAGILADQAAAETLAVTS